MGLSFVGSFHVFSIALLFVSIWLLPNRSGAADAGKEYTVGDSSGWNTGVDYSSWASQHTFHIGDSLKFSYAPGVHTVQQVDAKDYKRCNSANAIMSGTTGTTTVKLDKAQTYYFVCGAPGHCEGGMQLSVTVTDNGASGSAPSPTIVPTNHTSPSSATSTPTTATPSDPDSNPTPTSPSPPSTNPSNNVSPFLHPSFSFLLICLVIVLPLGF